MYGLDVLCFLSVLCPVLSSEEVPSLCYHSQGRTSDSVCAPIALYCIVLKGWSLLLYALRSFQDLLYPTKFRYY
jgi:hypothetical protein